METLPSEGPVLSSAVTANALWVMVRVGDEHLVLPSESILEMVRAPVAHKLPYAPPAVRGVAPLRGQVGLVVDMRQRLGVQSLEQEQAALIDLLHAREKDHRAWLDDLEGAVREHRAFTRTLDPHACAFGKWYDQYKAPTLELEWYLRQFAEPHAKIHAEGAVVAEHMQHARHAEAAAVIEHTRDGVLARLITLFEGARRLVTTSAREIAVIVNVRGRSVGLVVDEVEGVDQIKSERLAALPPDFGSKDRAIIGTARTRRDDREGVVVDLALLTEDYAAAAA
jgi:chemotaxis signal transduction protein